MQLGQPCIAATYIIAALTGIAGSATSAAAASESFGLEYRVERADAGRLTLPACLKTAQVTSAKRGYVPAMQKSYPGQLAVFASGPLAGGGSLTVYCIAVDKKTAYVVQALDYNRAESAAARKAADTVHRALLAASS